MHQDLTRLAIGRLCIYRRGVVSSPAQHRPVAALCHAEGSRARGEISTQPGWTERLLVRGASTQPRWNTVESRS